MIFVFFGLLQQISCAEPIFERTTIFKSGMYGTKFYRIPAIAHMRDRSMLLVVDNRFDHNADLPQKIGVYARIRYENATLTDPFFISGVVRPVGDGDAALVVDRKTGIVFCLWSGERGFWGSQMSSQSNPERVYFSKSYDNGVTWETKVDITHYIYSNLCFQCDDDERKKWLALFVTSGGGIQTRDGTIMFACLVKYTASEGHKTRNFILFTDDLGKSWNMKLGWPVSGADEAKLVQMNNGTVLMSIRQRGQRKFAWTNDKGDSWYRAIPMPDVKDPNCNGEIKRYTSVIDGFDKDRMLHSIAYNPSQRQNVSLMISYDEGFTWPIKKVIESGGSAYSAIDIDSEGNIFVFFEANDESGSGYKNDLVKVNLEWLTDGADTYKKPQLLNWCLSSNKEDSNCPEKSYIFNEKVFDGYVESYLVYPKQVYYTFLESFRDFNVDLSLEGLEEGVYINKNSTRFHLNFINGQDRKNRQFNFTNLDVSYPFNSIWMTKFHIKNTKLVIYDVYDAQVILRGNEVRIYHGNAFVPLIVPADSQLVLINKGNVIFYSDEDERPVNPPESRKKSPRELSNVNFTIISGSPFATVQIDGSWTTEEAEAIRFESNSFNRTQLILRPEHVDSFGTPENVNITILPSSTQTPTQGSTPSQSPTIETTDKDDSNNNNNNKGCSNPLSLGASIGIAAAFFVLGLAIGIVAVYIPYKKLASSMKHSPSDFATQFNSFL